MIFDCYLIKIKMNHPQKHHNTDYSVLYLYVHMNTVGEKNEPSRGGCCVDAIRWEDVRQNSK